MKLCVIGGGTHSNVVIDVAEHVGYNEFYIFDDKKLTFKSYSNKKYIGNINKINNYQELDCFIAIGNNLIRKKLFNLCKEKKNKIISLIHPNAYVSKSSKVGIGSILMPNTVINANSHIKNCCIINTGSTIDHDCIISNFTHIAPGVNIAGNVKVGSETFVGIGSKIINNISIRSKSFITAGTIIKKNL